MRFLRTFGLGSKKIIAQDHRVTGTVTDVKKCWWLKINTKPVRTSMNDGAGYPHIISFTYEVQGVAHQGSRYVPYTMRCPQPHEKIAVYYDPTRPEKYAVSLREASNPRQFS